MSFLKIEFFGKIDVVAWLLMTTLKDKSIHSQSSILLVCFFWNNSLMNDSSCHNGDKDGDQNTDLLDDWFFDNEKISVCLQLEFVCIFVCLQLQFVCIDVDLQVVENLLR